MLLEELPSDVESIIGEGMARFAFSDPYSDAGMVDLQVTSAPTSPATSGQHRSTRIQPNGPRPSQSDETGVSGREKCATPRAGP